MLELLVRDGQLYGLQLVGAAKGRLERGTIYVTLRRMEDKGCITSKLGEPPPGAGGLPRRIYEATPLGKRMLKAWKSGVTRLVPRFAQWDWLTRFPCSPQHGRRT